MSASGGYPILRNPPIIEALLSIHVSGLDPTSLPAIESLKLQWPEYHVISAAFSARSTEGGDVSGRDIVGYDFTNGSASRVIHARVGAFALSFLGKYPRFEDLEREAKRLWPLYRAAFPESRIVRVGLRYINRIEFPIDVDFSEYLKTFPEIARTLPQGLQDFAMRLVLPDSDSRCNAVIQEVMEDDVTDRTSIFFDIDAFQTPDADQSFVDDEVWSVVAELRRYKNRLFFESITQKLLEVYGVE